MAVVRYDDIVLWHYAFADHRFKISATTDRHGGPVETAGAREGLAELLGLIQADRLVAFLGEAHPFTPVNASAAPATQSTPLRQVPLLQPSLRHWPVRGPLAASWVPWPPWRGAERSDADC